jgi:hypothetical protein
LEGVSVATNTNTVLSDTWCFICGTFDWPNAVYNLYVNGALSTQNTALRISSGYIQNDHDVFLMARGNSGGTTDAYNRTTGRFAMFMMHSRILTATEVLNFYNSSKGRLV